eukprot:m51a1_g9668 putative acidstable alpha-amylase (461) ;mRNA; r:1236603-1238474
MNSRCCTAALLLLAAASCALAADGSEWKQRTIYQLLTDRFALSDGSSRGCDVHNYCGGTFEGIRRKLDYIQGMGFDAIWISPILKNSDGGYHGYWANNFFAVNEHFGSEDDLRNLINDAHNRSMYVMIDFVANHVGYGSIYPFDKSEHYHDCNGCPSDCSISNYKAQYELEHCRLAGLMDLNQDGNDWVKQQLIASGKYVVGFGADGLRLDTVPEVSKGFWSEFRQAVGTFMVGEVWDERMDFSAGYQGPIDSVLAYPAYNSIMASFGNGQCNWLSDMYKAAQKYYKDTSVLGLFADNHDNRRFLNMNGDEWKYKNALAYVLMADGMPMIYYGTEQGYAGGADPDNREALWSSGYNTESAWYKFINATVRARKAARVWEHSVDEHVADQQCYAFSRGDALAILTNVGTQGSVTRTITGLPYSNGQRVCNIYYPDQDCAVINNGSLQVTLMHGEPKIFRPV